MPALPWRPCVPKEVAIANTPMASWHTLAAVGAPCAWVCPLGAPECCYKSSEDRRVWP